MKLRAEVILFLFVSILLACQSIFASDQEVRISDADEEWTVGAEQIAYEAVDSSDAPEKLPIEAAVCLADEVLNFGKC